LGVGYQAFQEGTKLSTEKLAGIIHHGGHAALSLRLNPFKNIAAIQVVGCSGMT